MRFSEGQRHRLTPTTGKRSEPSGRFLKSTAHHRASRRTALGAKFKPEHALALFHDVSRETVPQAEFDLPQTLDYLRKNEIDPSLLQEGINMVCYNGLPLGWIKRIGGRCNNLYPKESRIAAL